MISFKANYVSCANVKKFNTERELKNYNARFVELDPENISDMTALHGVAEDWDLGESFAKNICNEARGIVRNWGEEPSKRFFAVVNNECDMKKLTPTDIMGVAEIYDKFDNVELKYLQVEPPYTEERFEPVFKYVGTSILNSLKKLIPDRNIILRSVETPYVKKFYKKNGFVAMNKKDWMIFKR